MIQCCQHLWIPSASLTTSLNTVLCILPSLGLEYSSFNTSSKHHQPAISCLSCINYFRCMNFIGWVNWEELGCMQHVVTTPAGYSPGSRGAVIQRLDHCTAHPSFVCPSLWPSGFGSRLGRIIQWRIQGGHRGPWPPKRWTNFFSHLVIQITDRIFE